MDKCGSKNDSSKIVKFVESLGCTHQKMEYLKTFSCSCFQVLNTGVYYVIKTMSHYSKDLPIPQYVFLLRPECIVFNFIMKYFSLSFLYQSSRFFTCSIIVTRRSDLVM